MAKKIKALALISGGLDSILSAYLVSRQNIEITGLTFTSLFFGPKIKPSDCFFPIISVNFSNAHLKIVKNPQYGYGKQMNPCLDCHLLMLKKGKEIMKKKGFQFLISGDVLNQRPFSQNKQALQLLEEKSGLKDLILRPLSAKLLSPTLPEKKGWVKRKLLLAIQGKSRKEQLKLAKIYGITNYTAPGTSCILTDPQFAKRLKKLLTINPQAQKNDIQLLKLGRHFWQGKTLFVIARNYQENLTLKQIYSHSDSKNYFNKGFNLLIQPKTFPGPSVLVRNWKRKISINQIIYSQKLIKKYSPKAKLKKLTKNDFTII